MESQPIRQRRPEKFCHDSWLHREWIIPLRGGSNYDYIIQNGEWQDRDANYMHYRGWRLKRTKFFLIDDPEEPPDTLHVYHYPGAQNETLLHHTVKTMPLIEKVLQELQRLEPGLNHTIGTLYESETDTIGFHSDQATDIREGSNIYLLSLSATRNLTLKCKSDIVIFDILLNARDLFIMDLKTNDEYEHAILPSDIKMEPQISLVVQDIKTTRSRGEIKVK
jgi:hypothetical protein